MACIFTSRRQEALTLSDVRRFGDTQSGHFDFDRRGPGESGDFQAGNHSAEGVATLSGLFPSRAGQKSLGPLTHDGQDEEAVVYTQSRMLHDPTGRLLYIGDSATLSYLQLIRMLVENAAGPSPFTTDPRRHSILESQMSLSPGFRHTHLLPEKRTARVLVEAFFINTHGLVQIFDRQLFLKDLEICYSDPLGTDPSWLCLLNLVFAIGLMLATPPVGSEDAAIIDKLRNENLDRAEVFYLNAKGLADPSAGFEDAGFWSIQALFLMAVYMLTKSKRNSAWAFFGMAVRSGFAQGLHREETMVIFRPEDQMARRNLWRSLYIMDRYLASSLGRPTTISDDDCSGNTLSASDSSFLPNASPLEQTNAHGLEASVRSCFVIGIILRRVYQQRKISTRVAQEIADTCKIWPKALAPTLHWRQATAANASQGMAILHVNMFYCHSIILLARPFFLFIMNTEVQRNVSDASASRSRRKHVRMEKFAEACVIASSHTTVLAQNAYDAGYLPRHDPTVIYFLFAAALIVLSNEFASLYVNANADKSITSAINIMAYCAETDPQAKRLVYVLGSFRNVVEEQRIRRMQQGQDEYATEPLGADLHISTSSTISGQQMKMPPTQISSSLEKATMPQQPTFLFSDSPPALEVPSISIQVEDWTADNAAIGLASADPPQAEKPFTSNALQPSVASQEAAAKDTTDSSEDLPLVRQNSLSDLLSLGNFDVSDPDAATSDGSWGLDDQIDFDALWAWPTSLTPAVGSPRFTGDMQGISDSTVPLFGTTDI